MKGTTKVNDMRFSDEFTQLIEEYKNIPESHRRIWETFYQKTNELNYLKRHRDFIERNKYGYGDRPFHYMWKLLVDQMPSPFSFLEIGVFKGQILSLIQLLADKAKKRVHIYGVTPLTNAGDQYSQHPDVDYLTCIKSLYAKFRIPFDNTTIIRGYSNEKSTMQDVKNYAPYDIIFVDGSHDYPIVSSDMRIYTDMLRTKGFFVVDDASCYRRMPKYYTIPRMTWIAKRFPPRKVPAFPGFKDVSRAVRDTIEQDKRFNHLFACGHDRVWQKIR